MCFISFSLLPGNHGEETLCLQGNKLYQLYLMTDDGSYGEKGFGTVKLQALLESGVKYDEVLAIGPVPMMKFVCKTTEPFGVHTMVSLNPIMVDGTGMCGGCRVTVGGETKFACVDGPEFDGHKVDYAELMSRNGTYREREAEVARDHVCRMEAMASRQKSKINCVQPLRTARSSIL